MVRFGGSTKLGGKLGLKVIRTPYRDNNSLRNLIYRGFPHLGLDKEVFNWRLKNCPRLVMPLAKIAVAKLFHINTFFGSLDIAIFRKDGTRIELGLAGLRLVTDLGVAFIVDGFQNIVEIETMKYHGIGTGSSAEGQTETALVTELTTQYASDNTRPTGTTTEGSGANIYESVATNTVDAAVDLREHALFDQASNSGGVMLDRTLFNSINLANGDSLQSTYDLTLTAGG